MFSYCSFLLNRILDLLVELSDEDEVVSQPVMVFIPSRDLPSLSIRDGLSVEEKLKRIQRGLEEIARALGVTIASGGGQEGEAQQHHVWVNSSEWKKRNAGQGVYLQEETGSEGIDQDRGHADDSDEHVDGRDDDDGDSDDDEDDFETRFVNEWLPRVACLKWLPLDFLQDREEKDNRNDPEGSLVTSPIDEIINAAARLIAICAGQSGEFPRSISIILGLHCLLTTWWLILCSFSIAPIVQLQESL